jgi:DNA-directed RNA polymerase subunit RPC12/RpoP
MPIYIYECLDCQKKAIKAHPDRLNESNGELELELYEQLVLFETKHGMNPTKKELDEAVVCPRCDGRNCEQSFHGSEIHAYTRGYGFLDKAGAHRDMNLYKLQTKDPYAEHRVPGEADDIANKLKKGGKHDPKTKHFRASNGTVDEKTVKKAVDKK